MMKKSFINSKSVSSFGQALVGLVLLVALAIALNALFASRSFQTASQPQQPAFQSLSPTLASDTSQADPTAGWKEFQGNAYNIRFQYPSDYFFTEMESIKPTDAQTIIVFAPEKYRSFLAPQAPMFTLTIFQGGNRSLQDWFSGHSTTKSFDDPSVSMKDSPYYYRQFSTPERLTFDGHPALSFTSNTMEGEVRHTLLVYEALIYDFAVKVDTETAVKHIYNLMVSTIALTSQ